MENNILVQGKGIITKLAVNSKNGFDAFHGKRNKKLFINILQDAADENVVLVAYCVLDATAHFIIKSNGKSDVDRYVATVTESYAANYDDKGRGNPLRADYVSQKIKSAELSKAVAYVHSLSPVTPIDYPYCSYGYLSEGIHGGTAVIIAENGGSMTEEDFLGWLDTSAGKGYKKVKAGKESFSAVLDESKARYLTGSNVPERTIIYILADLCERSGAKYKKAAKALGISYKDRRDVMIGVLIELMNGRGYAFPEAVALMQIFTEDRQMLLLDCIVEQNRLRAYSYDHIIHSFGICDYYYDILAEIMRGLHRKYGFGFEELCVKFHVQNDILSIRARCGF